MRHIRQPAAFAHRTPRLARGAPIGVAAALLCAAVLGTGCAHRVPPGFFAYLREERVFARRSDGALRMTISRPLGAPGRRPMVVLFHGGGFNQGHRNHVVGLADHLAAQGFVAAAASYRLAPAHPFPAAVQDAFAAVRYLRARAADFDGDPQRMATLGLSAGATLAMMVAYCDEPDGWFGDAGDPDVSPRVQAVVNVYGPCDLSYNLDKARAWVRRAAVRYVGCTPQQNPAVWRLASPRTFIDAADPPTLTIHGRRDSIVGFEQALLLAEDLRAAGVAHWLVPLDAEHGWGYVFATREWYQLLPTITTFLVRTLESPGPSP